MLCGDKYSTKNPLQSLLHKLGREIQALRNNDNMPYELYIVTS